MILKCMYTHLDFLSQCRSDVHAIAARQTHPLFSTAEMAPHWAPCCGELQAIGRQLVHGVYGSSNLELPNK